MNDEWEECREEGSDAGLDSKFDDRLDLDFEEFESEERTAATYRFTIPEEIVESAFHCVLAYNEEERYQRFQDIDRDQPHMMTAVLDLPFLHGVSEKNAEHAGFILLFLYECFQEAAPKLPTVSYDCVKEEYSRVTDMILYFIKSPAEEFQEWTLKFIIDHDEHPLLKYYLQYMRECVVGSCHETELVRITCLVYLNCFLKAYRAL